MQIFVNQGQTKKCHSKKDRTWDVENMPGGPQAS